MKANALALSLILILVPLAGCAGSDGEVNVEPTTELDDWQVHYSATASDLPICNEETNGRIYYVEADVEFQVCKTAGWQVIDIIGPAGVDGQDGADGTDGQDGADGTDGQDGISILIRVGEPSSCNSGGNTFEIGSDSNGDGDLGESEVSVTVEICNEIGRASCRERV